MCIKVRFLANATDSLASQKKLFSQDDNFLNSIQREIVGKSDIQRRSAPNLSTMKSCDCRPTMPTPFCSSLGWIWLNLILFTKQVT